MLAFKNDEGILWARELKNNTTKEIVASITTGLEKYSQETHMGKNDKQIF